MGAAHAQRQGGAVGAENAYGRTTTLPHNLEHSAKNRILVWHGVQHGNPGPAAGSHERYRMVHVGAIWKKKTRATARRTKGKTGVPAHGGVGETKTKEMQERNNRMEQGANYNDNISSKMDNNVAENKNNKKSNEGGIKMKNATQMQDKTQK